jgi:hypothetical protein
MARASDSDSERTSWVMNPEVICRPTLASTASTATTVSTGPNRRDSSPHTSTASPNSHKGCSSWLNDGTVRRDGTR